MFDKFTLLFTSYSISLGFFRLFIIQEKFTSDIFRGYALFIVPALFVVELENIRFDLSRKKSNYKNNSINFAVIILFLIPVVLFQSENYVDNIKIIIFVLICGALIEGFINVKIGRAHV